MKLFKLYTRMQKRTDTHINIHTYRVTLSADVVYLESKQFMYDYINVKTMFTYIYKFPHKCTHQAAMHL